MGRREGWEEQSADSFSTRHQWPAHPKITERVVWQPSGFQCWGPCCGCGSVYAAVKGHSGLPVPLLTASQPVAGLQFPGVQSLAGWTQSRSTPDPKQEHSGRRVWGAKLLSSRWLGSKAGLVPGRGRGIRHRTRGHAWGYAFLMCQGLPSCQPGVQS